MNFLPVITRELQVQSRQPATNRLRLVAAAGMIALWCLLMVVNQRPSGPERAQMTFIAISVVCLGGVMLAGVFQTADCLSEERREGTLGLLFLTDLRGYDVVFGKLASTSMHTLFALLAIVPVLALPLLMGGTTAGEFWRVSLVLLVTLYLSLSIGMLISALNHDSRAAMVGTLLVMVLLAGISPLLYGLASLTHLSTTWSFLLWPCPPVAYQQAFDLYYTSSRGGGLFWPCIFTMLVMATSCLVTACLLLPRVWQESGARQMTRRNEPAAAGPPAYSAQARLRGTAPFLWLTTRHSRLRRSANIFFLVLLVIWAIFFLQAWSRQRMMQGMSFAVCLLLAYGLHLVLKSLVAVESSRRLSEDRQSGALELLLVTPLPIEEIIRSQVAGVWRIFRWQITALTLVNGGLLWSIMAAANLHMDGEATFVFFLLLTGGIVMLFLDIFALLRVGMWQALTQKRHARAFLATVLRVMLPAWLAVVLVIFMGMGGAFSGVGSASAVIVFWFVICGFVDAVAASAAAANLDQNFREIVSLGRLESVHPLGIRAAPISSKSP